MEYKPVALHPDDVEFKVGQVYFAKLKFSHKIEPIWCSRVDDSITPRSNPKSKKMRSDFYYAEKNDIEYVVGGIPVNVLIAAHQARLFGKRRVAEVETG